MAKEYECIYTWARPVFSPAQSMQLLPVSWRLSIWSNDFGRVASGTSIKFAGFQAAGSDLPSPAAIF